MEVLFLKPHTEHPIWSGDKLRSEYNINCDKAIGEAFNLSTLPLRESTVINGANGGKKLTEVLRNNPGYALPSSISNGELPLLFKLIDTSDKLSVQVHPNDTYAKANENQLGKTESWYIIDAEKGSFIYLGLNGDYSRDTLELAIKKNTIESFLNKIFVKPGDYFYIPSGTIHALGSGITIAEIQQSSMVTYRLYDFGRRDKNGKCRELHVNKSLDVLSYKKTDLKSLIHSTTPPSKNNFFVVDSEKYFEVLYADISKNVTYGYEDFSLLTVISGYGMLSAEGTCSAIQKGQSIFVPKGLTVQLSGNIRVLVDRIPMNN